KSPVRRAGQNVDRVAGERTRRPRETRINLKPPCARGAAVNAPKGPSIHQPSRPATLRALCRRDLKTVRIRRLFCANRPGPGQRLRRKLAPQLGIAAQVAPLRQQPTTKLVEWRVLLVVPLHSEERSGGVAHPPPPAAHPPPPANVVPGERPPPRPQWGPCHGKAPAPPH